MLAREVLHGLQPLERNKYEYIQVEFDPEGRESVSSCGKITSAGRAFGSGCLSYSAPVREPKDIGARPKEHSFWPRLRTEAIE